MRRECAALALFSLRRKQARPVREPDEIFDKQPSALSTQHSDPLVTFRSSRIPLRFTVLRRPNLPSRNTVLLSPYSTGFYV